MTQVDLEEVIINVYNSIINFVPESDHVEMMTDLLRSLENNGYNLKSLFNHNEVIDEALGEIYPDLETEEYDDYD